jgi:hypothetical protein
MTISTNSSAEEEKGYIPSVTKLTSNRLTPEVLWSFGRISGENCFARSNQGALWRNLLFYREKQGF